MTAGLVRRRGEGPPGRSDGAQLGPFRAQDVDSSRAGVGGDGPTASPLTGWTFPDAPVKRYVSYTAVGTGGHLAVDSAGGVRSRPDAVRLR